MRRLSEDVKISIISLGEVTQCVQCLSCKHEDLSSCLQHQEEWHTSGTPLLGLGHGD